MGNEIGTVTGVKGTSLAMNNQAGCGGVKPSASGGNASPGGTKPTKKPDAAVPMPK